MIHPTTSWAARSDLEPLGITPDRSAQRHQLVNWARGNYGAVEGGTDSDHTVNGNEGTTNAPFKGTSKRGVMGVNFGVSLAAITDGTSNTAFFAEMRSGVATIDIRGTWAMGMAGASLCCETRPYNPTPNCKNWAGPLPATMAATSCKPAISPGSECPTWPPLACPAIRAPGNFGGHETGSTTAADRPAACTPAGSTSALVTAASASSRIRSPTRPGSR